MKPLLANGMSCLKNNIQSVHQQKKSGEKLQKSPKNSGIFSNCVGALDGKHIVIQAPAGSGSSFFNYKKTFSISLLAVCDAKYRFTLVDIGDSGRQSDCSVYNNSHLGHSIENKPLDIPEPAKLTNSDKTLPFVFVGDDAFGLKEHLMKPYISSS